MKKQMWISRLTLNPGGTAGTCSININRKKMIDQDFIRTESYSLRLKPSGAKKLTQEFNI